MENRAAGTQVGVNPETPLLDVFLDHPIRNEEDCLRALLAVLDELATYIDHVDHHEPADATIIQTSGRQILNIVTLFAEFKGVDLPTAYGERLAQIEEANSARYSTPKPGLVQPSGAEIILSANSWSEMQEGQKLHDEQFHATVIKNPESWKLGHYANHLTKLPNRLSRNVVEQYRQDPANKHLADLTAFGIKLLTEFVGRHLPDTPVRR